MANSLRGGRELPPEEPARLRPAQLVRAATVARLYFLESKSKSEIADELGINRFKVARILEQARESGLVRIEISAPDNIDYELSEQLRRTYDLRHVVAVETGDATEVHLRTALAQTATALVSELVTENDVLGVGYGRTLTIMAQTMDSLACCPVVQLTGALLGVNAEENSVELVRQISARNGGPAFPMYIPQVLPDAATAAMLRRQPEVAEAHRRFPTVTKAVVAVGSWNPPSSQLYDALPAKERTALLRRGVAAEICATLLDAKGNTVAQEFTDRCISINSTQLKAIDDVIAVAGGPTKLAALRSVILSGHVTSIVTDAALARALVAERAPARLNLRRFRSINGGRSPVDQEPSMPLSRAASDGSGAGLRARFRHRRPGQRLPDPRARDRRDTFRVGPARRASLGVLAGRRSSPSCWSVRCAGRRPAWSAVAATRRWMS